MNSKLLLLLIVLLFFTTNSTYSNVAPLLTTIQVAKEGQQAVGITKKQSFQYFKKAMEIKLGRKLKWKEKITIWYSTHAPGSSEAEKAKTKALLGFIFGLVSVIIFPPLAIPGLIFSINALNKEKQQPGILDKGSKGMAIAGLILSILGLLALVILFLYVIAFVGLFSFAV